tara:strand:+ start:391 stop:642 length:252 start_codon:yes stop_codon:yes gene_type:complete
MTTIKTLNHGTPFRQKHFTDYDQEMLTALYRTIGYLNEQGTSTPEIRKALCNEITKIEDKAKADEAEDTDWMDFNSTMSPCHY